jgi:ATP-dependent Clp protease ATP-binding subunit ClpA
MSRTVSQRLIRVLLIAQQEAQRTMKQIDCEELLLGLCSERAIPKLGETSITFSDLRAKCEAVRTTGVREKERGQQAERSFDVLDVLARLMKGPEVPDWSSEAKLALEHGWRHVTDADQGRLDTEHLLLGIIETGNPICLQLITHLGLDVDDLKQALQG